MQAKKELEPIPDFPERNGGVTREEIIERVRVELVRYLERNRRVDRDAVAKATGYKPKTIDAFISKERPSLVLAQKIILEFPEIGRGLRFVCPHCHRIPHFAQHGG